MKLVLPLSDTSKEFTCEHLVEMRGLLDAKKFQSLFVAGDALTETDLQGLHHKLQAAADSLSHLIEAKRVAPLSALADKVITLKLASPSGLACCCCS